jgi:hypothetical protein
MIISVANAYVVAINCDVVDAYERRDLEDGEVGSD